MSDLAQKTSRGLEKARRKVLGADAEITLFDKAGEVLVTVRASFFVSRKSSLALGEEWLECEISEQEGVTQAVMLRVVTLRYQGAIFSASQSEDPMTAERVFKLRLTPVKRKS